MIAKGIQNSAAGCQATYRDINMSEDEYTEEELKKAREYAAEEAAYWNELYRICDAEELYHVQ